MKPPELLVYHARQCDPKACTALKLKRFKLVRELRSAREIPRGATVLNPFAQRALSRADSHARRLVALDCSWEKAKEVFAKFEFPGARALPLLVAGNPINYGKVSILSTAEALAASLYITGFISEGLELLSKFKWGPTFLDLNRELLEEYSRARDSREVVEIQRGYFQEALDGEVPRG